MTGTCRIRAVTPADLPALRELFLAVRRLTFVWQPPDAFHLEDFDTQTEGERAFVAEAGDQIAGFISVWEPDDCKQVGPGFLPESFSQHDPE